MAQKIEYSDNLKKGTDKLNESIQQSNVASQKAITAEQTANQAIQQSESTQTQLDNIVIEGDSSVEAAQARVDSKGESFPTLKSRLDNFEVSATQQLQQIAINGQQEFNFLNNADNTAKIKDMLESNYENILIPAGMYKITDTLSINTGVNKKVFGSGLVTIIIDLPINTDFLKTEINIEFENITFDFNNSYLRHGLLYGRNLGSIKLHNLKFKNLYDMGSTYGTNVVQVQAQGNTVDIDGIVFENMTKLGNEIVEDSDGNLTGIYYGDNSSYPGALKGKIVNVKATNLKNINEMGAVINEDVSSVYAYNTDIYKDGQLLIDEVQGHNFGKRLVKVDASNVEIGKVIGHSDLDNVTSLVGLNNTNHNKKNIKIGSLKASGLISAVLATDALEVVVDNVYTDQTKGSAILVSRGGLTVNNLYSNAPRAVYINAPSAVRGVEIKTLTLGDGASVSEGVTIAHAQGVSDFKIGRLIVKSPNQLVSVINTEASSSNQDVSIDQVILNLTNTTAIPLRLLGIDGLKIGVISATNDTDAQVERLIRLRGCKNVEIGDITSNIKTIACVDIRDASDNISIGKITSPRATYDVSMVASTRVYLKDANISKLLMNDEAARRNLMPELPYTTGTTGNRPTKPKLGHLYYNRTYNLLSVCTAEAVVASDGSITTPAVWSNLTLSQEVI
ncbi:MAG TPA: hypothetical protein H9948_06855 [Candidatus Jeotgalibaca merdavium]|uniref:Uncharacterized protein n=1 Tax=Candidatus Jeotgalibaca merdavium TaxID=2838627 RepID=A0A9D2KXQ6_9LACT|nr:hypothetical protein [Candidatus Jeotgalibaca merdavium]